MTFRNMNIIKTVNAMKSDTIAGMIVMAIFVLWCLYMAGWILYMSWPRKTPPSRSENSELPKEPEDPDEFDPEQVL